jgi:hypothetical protein
VRQELADPFLARELLHYLWEKAADGLASRDQLPARGLRLTWHEVAGRATALFHLPTPQATAEAYFVALVYEEAIADEEDTVLAEVRPRYFTLEATLGLATNGAGKPTMLGELAGDQWRQYGRGPAGGLPSTPEAFLQAVADVLGPLPDELPIMHIVR